MSHNPYSTTGLGQSAEPARQHLRPGRAVIVLAIMATALLGGLIATLLVEPPPRVGVLALVTAGVSVVIIITLSVRGIVATAARSNFLAVLKFTGGRILSVVITGVLIELIAQAGIGFLPGPDFVRVGLIGCVFGFYESMLLSMSYRVSFDHQVVWPFYVWPALVNTFACGAGIASFVLFEDLAGKDDIGLGVTVLDLRMAFLLGILGAIEASRVTAFAFAARSSAVKATDS